MSTVRHRKSKEAKKSPQQESSDENSADKLTEELQDALERAREKGASREEFESALRRATNIRSPRGRVCLSTFDCCWTLVLALCVAVLIVMYVPQVNFFVQTALHPHAYSIMRSVRFGFLAVHPYFLLFGVDLTNTCLLANPLSCGVSDCPCVYDPHPIEVFPDGKISQKVVRNFSKFQILRGVVPIEREYGRASLLEYSRQYGFVPEPCLTLNYSPNEGPQSLSELASNENWDKHMSSEEPWDYTWQECHDREDIPEQEPLYSLLPHLDTYFEDTVRVKSKDIIYSISKEWGRAFAYMPDNVTGVEMLVVLNGRVRLKVQTAFHCMEHCPPHLNRQGYLLNQGDAVIYDKRYWSYNTQTWSNISFTIAAGIEIQD